MPSQPPHQQHPHPPHQSPAQPRRSESPAEAPGAGGLPRLDWLPGPVRGLVPWAFRLGLGARVAWGAVAAASLLAVAYLANPPAIPDLVPLYAGESLTRDQARDLAQVLDEAGIASRLEASGPAAAGTVRVSVAREETAAAYKAIQKAGRTPRSLADLVDAPLSTGLLATAAEVERQANRRREQIVESAIRQVDTTLSPLVQIFVEPARGLARTRTTSVTVNLSAADGRRIAPETIERIRNKVRSFVPAMDADGLTILDADGTPYILPGQPAVARQNAIKAREDEIRSAILEQLATIDGVRVGVTVSRAAAGAAADDPASDLDAPGPAPLVIEPLEAHLVAPLPLGDAPAESEAPSAPAVAVAVAVNQPFEDEAAAEAVEAEEAREPAPAAVADSAEPLSSELASDSEDGLLLGGVRVDVQVYVPSTYYAALGEQFSASANREPTLADLESLVRQTQTMIRHSIELVVPAGERGEIVVERLFVPDARSRPEPGSTAATVRDRMTAAGWRSVHLAVAGLIVAALVVTAVLAAAGRHQRRREVRRRPDHHRDRGGAGSAAGAGAVPRDVRYRFDGPETAAPSERVRDLVRLDPAAAAGVLQRWIGGGASDDPRGAGS